MFYFDQEWHEHDMLKATLAMLRMDAAERNRKNKEKTRGTI